MPNATVSRYVNVSIFIRVCHSWSAGIPRCRWPTRAQREEWEGRTGGPSGVARSQGRERHPRGKTTPMTTFNCYQRLFFYNSLHNFVYLLHSFFFFFFILLVVLLFVHSSFFSWSYYSSILQSSRGPIIRPFFILLVVLLFVNSSSLSYSHPLLLFSLLLFYFSIFAFHILVHIHVRFVRLCRVSSIPVINQLICSSTIVAVFEVISVIAIHVMTR